MYIRLVTIAIAVAGLATLNLTGCDTGSACGNGTLEPGEECDVFDLGGATCESATGFPEGKPACMPDCKLDTSSCHECGNGSVEGPEICDSADLGGQDCSTYAGHSQGELECAPNCVEFDTSDCHTCGDGHIQGPEHCDGADFGGLTCQDLGHPAGELECTPECNLVSLGCHDCDDPGSCDGVRCSGHGTCFIDGCQPTCNCDPGYELVDGLQCVRTGGCKLTGEECSNDADCCGGMCLKYTGDLTGYCYERDCVGDDSCVNHSTTDDAEMCCVDVGGSYFICMKILEGYACGDQTGLCGEPCAGQIDSACDPTQACLMAGMDDPGAVCAHECATNNDCDDCLSPFDPQIDFTCQAISGGATYCLAGNPDRCDSSLDCWGDDVCIPVLTEDGLSIEGQCTKLGDLPAGHGCDESDDPNQLPPSQRCAGYYCIEDHCSEVCTHSVECPESMVCADIAFCLDDPCDLLSSIGMCQWFPGSGTSCDGDPDCPAGEVCDYYLAPLGGVVKACTTRGCDPLDADCGAVGDPCGQGLPPCANGVCLDTADSSYCSALCEVDADCPDTGDPDTSFACSDLSVGSGQVTGACTL